MSTQENKPTVISTFSGCGGSSLGYQNAGFKILLAVEFDANAVETYARNFPNTDIYHGDIKTLSVEHILTATQLKVGELDVFDGSPPCQGFSTAGQRKFEDPRNDLFLEYVRLLKGLQPKCFVMENVSGMIKGKMKLKFRNIFNSLTAAGYRVRAQLLNTKHFKVPQARQRVIFIGLRNDFKPDFNFEYGSVFPKSTAEIVSLKKALINVPVDPPPPSLTGKNLALYKFIPPGASAGETHKKLYGKASHFNTCRLHWDRPAPTITKLCSRGISGYLHPTEPRNMTISELKRIATFPDDFEFCGKFEEKWARIGNSVPPKFMEAIANHIKQTLLINDKTMI